MTDETAALVARMNEAAQNATPGPWFQTGAPWYRDGSGVVAGSPDGNVAPLIVDTACVFDRTDYEGPFEVSDPEADAAHIAASNPASVLALIAAYEAEKERADEKAVAYDKLLTSWADCRSSLSEVRADRDALVDMIQKGYEKGASLIAAAIRSRITKEARLKP